MCISLEECITNLYNSLEEDESVDIELTDISQDQIQKKEDTNTNGDCDAISAYTNDHINEASSSISHMYESSYLPMVNGGNDVYRASSNSTDRLMPVCEDMSSNSTDILIPTKCYEPRIHNDLISSLQSAYLEGVRDGVYISHYNECYSRLPIYRNTSEKSLVESFVKIDYQQNIIQSGTQLEIKEFHNTSLTSANYASSQYVKITDLLTPYNRTIIYGDSHVGKSFAALEMISGIVFQRNCFFLKSDTTVSACYIDSKSDGDYFKKRIFQLNKSRYCNIHFISARFEMLSRYNIQDSIINYLVSNNIKVVFIDDIVSLFPDTVPENIKNIIEFIKTLEQKSIAVVLVNTTDVATCKLIESCENVLHVKGRKQIRADFENDNRKIPTVLARAFEVTSGAVVRIEVEKCNVCPELENQPFYYRLPINDVWEEITLDTEPCEIAQKCTPTPQDDDCAMQPSGDTNEKEYGSLTTDEQEVIVAAHIFDKVKNAIIQKLLTCGHSTASTALSGLCKKGLLQKENTGPATIYTLTEHAHAMLRAINIEELLRSEDTSAHAFVSRLCEKGLLRTEGTGSATVYKLTGDAHEMLRASKGSKCSH